MIPMPEECTGFASQSLTTPVSSLHAQSPRAVSFLIRTVLVRAPFRHGSLQVRGSSIAHTLYSPYPR